MQGFRLLLVLLALPSTAFVARADSVKDTLGSCSAECGTGERCAKYTRIACGKHVTCRERNQRERNHCVAVASSIAN